MPVMPSGEDPIQLQGIDYVELYVGNALQSAHFYQTIFGFTPVAHSGLETNSRDRKSIVMKQGECTLVLTAPLQADGPIAEHVHRHGDGLKDIAFRVEDVAAAFEKALAFGARSALPPTVFHDQWGTITRATVTTYGDTTHSFIQRNDFTGIFLPDYAPLERTPVATAGFACFDHFAVSLPRGEVQTWVDFYKRGFGFAQIHEEGIQTEYSAMSSIAVQDPAEKIRFVLIEPKDGKRRSQVEEFLQFYGSPGVQHIALETSDIIETISALRSRGLGLVTAPASYYDLLPSGSDLSQKTLARSRI
ncbi:4-hydroxyphenylpyruvate dioxygenase [Dictyobacter vulcani]|uniref:4-hydroxyphenylpyruvate dioxygenase n=1 Tax=Dictyobacter vulcani TaxID=2607529 RepID=A0A5J4KYW8_9CHLR|nr:VOC family protein [Dictyobacter vulcani]GER91720.1 4-hydroxyphenylpyruvate dioxygenase [Dictyobacter vulcani]